MSVEILVIASALVMLSAFFSIVPNLTRPDLFFAVTVAPEFRRTPEAKQLLRNFRAIVWISTLAAVALELSTGLILPALLIQTVGYLCALVNAHHKALAFAAPSESTVEVDLAAPLERLPGGPLVVILPILALAALAIWAGFNLDRLPQRFPVHWGFNGPDRWVITTAGSIFGFLALTASLCALLAGSAWGLLNWSRRISTSGPRAVAERRFRKRVVQLLILAEYFCACPPFFALLQLPAAAISGWTIAFTVAILFLVITLIRAGQGGSRVARSADAQPAGDLTPDACWKWGIVYFNPADPAIFVEKRFGVGYSINLGNRWSWAVLALFLVPLAIGLFALRT